MTKKKNIIFFYTISFLFIAINTWFILKKQSGLVCIVPFALIVVYLAIFSLDKLILFVVFCTPLSVNLSYIPDIFLEQVGVNAAIPTEPIMFCIMLLFLLMLVHSGKINNAIARHPISLIILFGLFWMLVTTVTSTMPLTSIKYLVGRCWAVVTFYFLGLYLFTKRKYIYTFAWLYIVPFTIVIVYTTIRHAHLGFSEKGAQLVMQPFYNDHTAYGAMLAMFIPVLIGLTVNRARSVYSRAAAFLLLLVFLDALGLSYSRAAWVSVVAALAVFLLLVFRVKPKAILLIVIVGAGFIYVYRQPLIMRLEHNSSQVSQNLTTDIQSISNVSSDASNLERLNRWSCAYRMFLDKPYLGYGPGTYMFKYAPYQLSYERTIISTNLANGGNAHSEYLGPLAEEGLFGMLSFLALAIGVFILSFNLFYKLKDRETKVIVASVFLGLVTYFVHGMVNDFLDTDKAAVPFWGFIAILVTIDLQTKGITLWKEHTEEMPTLSTGI